MEQVASSTNMAPSLLSELSVVASNEELDLMARRETSGTSEEQSPGDGTRSDAHNPSLEFSEDIPELGNASFRLPISSESIEAQRDIHPSTSYPPDAEQAQTSHEHSRNQDINATTEALHPQTLLLNDSTFSTGSQYLAIPDAPSLQVIQDQNLDHVIEDFDLPLDEDFAAWANGLDDAPIDEYDWEMNTFNYGNSNDLMNTLEDELQNPPPTGVPFKSHKDRNKGLDVPAKPD